MGKKRCSKDLDANCPTNEYIRIFVLKILHVNTIDTGGAAIAARRLHELLIEKGIESKMLFLKRSGKVKIKEAYYFEDLYSASKFRTLFKMNTIYNRRNTFYKPGIYFNGPESLFDLSAHPLFEWADVVHLHWVVKFLDWEKVFKHKTKRFVWTFHDMNPFTGGEHYQTGYHDEFKSVSKRNIELKQKAIVGNDINVICPSAWLSDLASKSEVFAQTKIHTIRNPIDDGIFKPLHSYLHKTDDPPVINKKNILFVAENPHDERKGFILLMKALENLNPDSYRLSVIGKKQHVEQVFKGAIFHGTVNDEEEMVKIYNSSDLFIIPSIEDNLPNTVSEALLCGTPVVGLSIGGVKEMITEGKNGFLAQNPDDLQQAIVNALNHHFVRQLVRNHAETLLDKEAIIESILDVYKSS